MSKATKKKPTQANLFPAQLREEQFAIHEHTVLSHTSSIVHSHLGGSSSHCHPDTGPSFYGYRGSKFSAMPSGKQLPYVARSEEESSFELVITDSAILNGEFPIGDTPIDQIHMAAAERMIQGARLKCIVRDERTKRA